MNHFIKIVFCTTIIWYLSASILAQEKTNLFGGDKHLIGFALGFGDQNIGSASLNVNYDYQVILFQTQYFYNILPKRTWGLDLVFHPQFNVTKFKQLTNRGDKTKGFEFGINVGLQIRKSIFRDYISLYFFASLGPHFVSSVPERQAEGFIFSDNLFIGAIIKLKENIFLNMNLGMRHLSNLNLKKPNGGINNLICGGGLLFALEL